MAETFYIRIRLSGATQFSSATPVATFNEFTSLNASPPSQTARITGFSYNSAGQAHQVRLVLTPPDQTTGGVFDIPVFIRNVNNQVNSFVSRCGPDGTVVPRRHGLEATAQPPVIATDFVQANNTYQLFFSTTGKNGDGVFTVWYSVGGG